MESDEVRAIRRALSADRTAAINNVGNYPAIRVEVIKALASLDGRLKQLNDSFRDEFSLDPQKKMASFYMKGGNAFVCIVNPEGSEATAKGGGNSDWDTQIIVDPWAPLPIQTMLYARIEEIVKDEMVKAGVEIARVVKPQENQNANFPTTPVDVTVKDINKQDVQYKLECDKPQTFRLVYDYNRTGLWMNDRRKLSDEAVTSRYIPGILLNDAIPPFLIFRLGYTWHAESDPKGQYSEIERPVLMELIDVTLPRRNTVEAVAVWEELERGELEVKNTMITVKTGEQKISQQVPLPGLMYHLNEISTMLCEVADGSSHHVDKLKKRFDRFKEIYENRTIEQQEFISLVSAIAGVSDVYDFHVHYRSRYVTEIINKYAPGYDQSTVPAIVIACNLMYIVASRQQNSFRPSGEIFSGVEEEFFVMRRAFLILLKIMNNTRKDILEGALSDDLVLIDTLRENSYIEVSKVKLSGIRQGIIIRVKPSISLDKLADNFISEFTRVLKPESLVWLIEIVPIDKRAIEKLRHLAKKKITIQRRSHNTVRSSGVTYEHTIVVFSDGLAVFCITLTSATSAEAPFRQDPQDQDKAYCSPAELASQRKVAAALIADYTIRTAIANQYEVLKRVLPNV